MLVNVIAEKSRGMVQLPKLRSSLYFSRVDKGLITGPDTNAMESLCPYNRISVLTLIGEFLARVTRDT